MIKEIALSATDQSVTVVMDSSETTINPDWIATWVDDPGSDAISEGEADGTLSGTTPVTLVPAPSSGVTRIVKELLIANTDSADVTFTIKKVNGTDERRIQYLTLAPNEMVTFDGVFDENGALKITSAGGPPVTSVTASSPLASSGGTTPDISLSSAVPLTKGGTGSNLGGTGPGGLIQASNGANVTILQHNWSATTAPTTGDDNTQGYAVGSMWYDTTNDLAYECLDASTGAAVWELKTLTATGVSANTYAYPASVTVDALGRITAISAGSTAIPAHYRSGLRISKLDAATLIVDIGTFVVNGTLVEITATKKLAMATAGDWVSGASDEGASQFAHVYMDASGNIRLHNKAPNYPRANTASRVFTALVNQSGWNGTAGNGLNATSVVYDGDTGEGSIVPGMWLLVYGSADSDYSSGRGRGSGASASVANLSAALITAVNTGTNTLTLAAGHQIAMNDNDRIIAVEAGEVRYRSESSVWWRWIGALYNNASSDLLDSTDAYASYTADEVANYTTTSSSFANVDATNWVLPILTLGGNIFISFVGTVKHSVNGAGIYFDVELDGARIGGDDGIMEVNEPTTGGYSVNVSFSRPIRSPTLGTHAVALDWKTSSATATMYAGAGTSSFDLHPTFAVRREAAQ